MLKIRTLIIKALSASHQRTDVLFGLSSMFKVQWEPLIYIKCLSTILVGALSWCLATVCAATREKSKKNQKQPKQPPPKILISVWWLVLNVFVLPSCSCRTYWHCRWVVRQLPFRPLPILLHGSANNCLLNCACTCFLFLWNKQFCLKRALTKAKVAHPAWPTDIKEITFSWCL